jgi:hypothetical protein
MNAKDILSYGHRDAIAAFQKVQVNDWAKVGVTTAWTPKDVLAHLVSYELLLEDALKLVTGKRDTPVLDAMNADRESFNEKQIGPYKDHSSAEILLEYTQAHTRVMELVEQLGPEKLRKVGTIPWYGKEYSLDDFIVYANYAHIREHVGQLTGWLKRQGR